MYHAMLKYKQISLDHANEQIQVEHLVPNAYNPLNHCTIAHTV